MTALFEPLTLCGVTLKNKIIISPMCTYSAESDGRATDWHLVHYGSFALGGAAMVMVEATAISSEGRHCYADLGIWADEQIEPLRRNRNIHQVARMRSSDTAPACWQEGECTSRVGRPTATR